MVAAQKFSVFAGHGRSKKTLNQAFEGHQLKKLIFRFLRAQGSKNRARPGFLGINLVSKIMAIKISLRAKKAKPLAVETMGPGRDLLIAIGPRAKFFTPASVKPRFCFL
jgi:hypothetical protein